MLNFHIKISRLVIYCLFFVCFFGSFALFSEQISQSLRSSLSGFTDAKAAFSYALKNFENDEILRLKSLSGGGFSIMHYDKKSSKREIKSSEIYFGAALAQEGAKSDFFKALHFKFLPAHGWLKQLGKALSTIVALLAILAIFSGLFALKRRWLFRLNAPKQRARLQLAHVNFGILAGAFLLIFCISGIGLNYLKDINNLFTNNAKTAKTAAAKNSAEPANGAATKSAAATAAATATATAAKKPAAKKKNYALNDEQMQAILQDFSAALADAKARLNTDELDIISSARSILMIKAASEFATRFDGFANVSLLVYKNGKLVKESYQKKAGGLTTVYNLFSDIHKLHAAPLWLRMLLASCGFACCIFMIYALKLSSINKPFNYLNIGSSCVFAACSFLFLHRFFAADLAIGAFYFCFFAALILGRFVTAKFSLYLIIFSTLLCAFALNFGVLAMYFGAFIIGLIFVCFSGEILGRKNATK